MLAVGWGERDENDVLHSTMTIQTIRVFYSPYIGYQPYSAGRNPITIYLRIFVCVYMRNYQLPHVHTICAPHGGIYARIFAHVCMYRIYEYARTCPVRACVKISYLDLVPLFVHNHRNIELQFLTIYHIPYTRPEISLA
jgi:hypothetical protein